MVREVILPVIIGYLLGCIPTAVWIARASGIDLRHQGSGNPGANNALRLGGRRLAALVLFTEMAKGAAAALLGGQLAGEEGMIAAGLGAAFGNLYNVFLRFKGGKGLGITAGVLLAAWPVVLVPILVVIGLAAWLTHSSDGATLIAIIALGAFALVSVAADLPTGWGVQPGPGLVILGFGLGLMIAPKHRSNIRFRRQHPA